MSTGAVVGIVLGLLVLIFLVTTIVVFLLKRRSLDAKAVDAAVNSAAQTPVGFDNAVYVTSPDKDGIVTDA